MDIKKLLVVAFIIFLAFHIGKNYRYLKDGQNLNRSQKNLVAARNEFMNCITMYPRSLEACDTVRKREEEVSKKVMEAEKRFYEKWDDK